MTATFRSAHLRECARPPFAPEEEAVGKTKMVPFLLEDKLKEQGALYEKGADWASFTVVDGRLVTGQNPGSAPETAKKALEAAGLAK